MRSALLVTAFVAVCGSCVTNPPQPCTDCNGICIDLQVDSKNCGTCGMACRGGTVCSAGSCVASCTNAQKLCGGACVDIQTDSANCGDCSKACDPGTACTAGTCQGTCASGYVTCLGDGGMPYCADLTSDPHNCTGCGHACGPAEACVANQCTTQCGTGRVTCTPMGGGATYCTDTTTDTANCGGCNQPCAAGLGCNNGHCDAVCNAPLTTCANGASTPAHYCANTDNDPANCGACGAGCGPSSFCVAGHCTNALASSCDELHTLFPSLGDGEVVLYRNGRSYWPFLAYCADMDGGKTQVTVSANLVFDDAGLRLKDDAGIYLFTDDSGVVVPNGGTEMPGPKTYLTLHLLNQSDAGYNFSQARLGPPYPPFVMNTFSKVRLEPVTNLVHNDDFRFATVSGITQNAGATNVEYGFAGACTGGNPPPGQANINLRGTPYSVNPGNVWAANNSFNPTMFGIDAGANWQTVAVTGNGSCGEFELYTNPLGVHKLQLDNYGLGCAQIHGANPSLPSGVYSLLDWSPNDAGSKPPLVYCDMTNVQGGWTLVMKVDGAKTDSRFFFDDPLWTNDSTYNEGSPDLSRNEAKYASFMATPFTQVYLIVTDKNGIQHSNVIGVAPQASMLAAMTGPFVPATSGIPVNAWSNLFGTPAGIQTGCLQQGLNNAPALNIRAEVRIGILGNEQLDCGSTDSYIGIGGELWPPGDCAVGKDAGFKGYAAGEYGAPACMGGNADAPGVAYVYVR